MKQSKKAEARLSARIADWAKLMETKQTGCPEREMRKVNGGFHKPGSNKK